jgi:uncharacterized protein DUF5666
MASPRTAILFMVVTLAAVTAAQSTVGQGMAGQSGAPESTATQSPGASNEEHDPLLDTPPLPKGKVTLIGGTVTGLDQIKNRITLQPFAGKKLNVFFDDRTHVYRDGIETTQLGIHKGDRVYVDTMLDKTRVFARNVRVITQLASVDARGRVVKYDAASGAMTLQDELSSEPVTFHVNSATALKNDHGSASASDLKPGTLVTVKLTPGRGKHDVAREVSVLAVPGATFTFSGRITYVNLRSRVMAVENESDKKTYEINFNPANVSNSNALHEGAQATIQAEFTGDGYMARNVAVTEKSE